MDSITAFSILSHSIIRRDDDADDDDHKDRPRTYGNRPATQTETIIIAIVFSVTIILILLGACYYYDCLSCGRWRRNGQVDSEKVVDGEDGWSETETRQDGYGNKCKYVRVCNGQGGECEQGVGQGTGWTIDLFGRR